RQAGDRSGRLAQAREDAAQGRLGAANELLLGLANDPDEGREARMLLKDVHRRIDLAALGLGQVQRAVHGQTSSSQKGLRQCLARLDEIDKVQSDLAGLTALRAQIE